jgi:hypothetical protein
MSDNLVKCSDSYILPQNVERAVYRRGGAIEDHEKVKQKLIQLHDEELDLTPYPHFKANVTEE